MRVLKFPLHTHGAAQMELPMGARLLHVAEQNGELMLWAACSDRPTLLKPRQINVAFTGHDIVAGDAEFIGTVISHDGSIVRHVFEEPVT